MGVPRTPVSSARSFSRLQSDLQAPIINSLLLLCRVHAGSRPVPWPRQEQWAWQLEGW